MDKRKKCLDCKKHKPVDEYYSNGKQALKPWCKPCSITRSTRSIKNRQSKDPELFKKIRRKYVACSKYKITHREFDELFNNSDGLCEICKRRVSLVIDHCHNTGRVRGLLCVKCNQMIGFADDDTDKLKSAIRYLRDKTFAHS